MKPGDRIGAILSIKDGTVNLLGWGTYEGEEVPPIFSSVGIKNPKLKLDSGHIVWGYQCWWGDEERLKKELEGHTIVQVDPEKELNQENQ